MGRILLLLIAIIFSNSLLADIYQSRDANGNLVFTDQASSGGQVVQLSQPNTYQPTIPALVSNPAAPAAAQSSKGLANAITITITNPNNNDSWLLSEDSYTVSATIRPTLQADQQAVLLVNSVPLPGAVVDGPQTSSINFNVNMAQLQNAPSFAIGQMNLQVAVINKTDNTQLAISSADIVYTSRARDAVLKPIHPPGILPINPPNVTPLPTPLTPP